MESPHLKRLYEINKHITTIIIPIVVVIWTFNAYLNTIPPERIEENIEAHIQEEGDFEKMRNSIQTAFPILLLVVIISFSALAVFSLPENVVQKRWIEIALNIEVILVCILIVISIEIILLNLDWPALSGKN